jgi:hypothetical protein
LIYSYMELLVAEGYHSRIYRIMDGKWVISIHHGPNVLLF